MASNVPKLEEISEDTKYCTNCTRHVAITNFLIHSLHCMKNIQLCNLCKEPFPTKEMDQHMTDYHQVESCEECGEVMERWELEKHKNLCSRRSSVCQYCMINLPFNTLSEHENYCGSRTVACVSCRNFIMIKHEKQHFEMCKKEQVMKKYGEKTRTFPADQEIVFSKRNTFKSPNDSTRNSYGNSADYKSSFYGEKQPFNMVEKESNVTKGLRKGRKGLSEKEMNDLIARTKDVFVVCYICNQSFLKSEVEEHTFTCTGNVDSVYSGHCETDASSNQRYSDDSKSLCYTDDDNTERIQQGSGSKKSLELKYEECPVCLSKISSKNLNHHITLCSEKKKICAFCKAEIFQLEEEEHLKKYCRNHNTLKKESNFSSAFDKTFRRKPYECDVYEQQLYQRAIENSSSESSNFPSSLETDKEQCPVCSSQISSLKFDYHLQYCVKKKTFCHFCRAEIFVIEEEEHLKKCDRIRNISTKTDTNYNSGMNKPSSFTAAVRSSFNSAAETVWSKLANNEFHEEISPKTESLINKPTLEKCSICDKSVPESDLNHLENCLKQAFKCRFCDAIMMPPKFRQHINNDCQEFKQEHWHSARGSGKRGKKKAKNTNYFEYFSKVKNINAVQTVKEEKTIMLPCEFCEVLIPENEIILHESGCRPDLVSFAKEINQDDLATCEDNLGATASGAKQKFNSNCHASPREYHASKAPAPVEQPTRTSSCVKKTPDNNFFNLHEDNSKRTTSDLTNRRHQNWMLNSNWNTSPGEYLSTSVSSAAEFKPQAKESEIDTSPTSSNNFQYINSLREETPKVDNEIKNDCNSYKCIPENLLGCKTEDDKDIVNMDRFLSFLNRDSDDEITHEYKNTFLNTEVNTEKQSNPTVSVTENCNNGFHKDGVKSRNSNDQTLWIPFERTQHSSDVHYSQFGDMTSIWSNSNQDTNNADSYANRKKEYHRDMK